MYNCRFQGPLTDHFPGQRLSKICDGTVEAETKLFLTVPPPLVKFFPKNLPKLASFFVSPYIEAIWLFSQTVRTRFHLESE